MTTLFVVGGCSCDGGASDRSIHVVYVNASTVNVASRHRRKSV